MNLSFKPLPFGFFTCYTFPCRYYDRTKNCSGLHCHRILKSGCVKYSYRPALHKALTNGKKSGRKFSRMNETELLKVTERRTTEMTMSVGKLNASHITAFASEPGMVLSKDTNSKKPDGKNEDHIISNYSQYLYAKNDQNINLCNRNKSDFINRSRNQNFSCNKSEDCYKPIQNYSPLKNANNITHEFITGSEQSRDKNSTLKGCVPIVTTLPEFEELSIKKIDSNFQFHSQQKKCKFREEEERNTYKYENKWNSTAGTRNMTLITKSKNFDVSDLMIHFNLKDSVLESEACKKAIFSYVEVCVQNDLLELAFNKVKKCRFTFPTVHNILLSGYSNKGDWIMMDMVLQIMRKKEIPFNYETYVIYLDSLGKRDFYDQTANVTKALKKFKEQGLDLHSIFSTKRWSSAVKENVLKQIRSVYPSFEIQPPSINPNDLDDLIRPFYTEKFELLSPAPFLSSTEMSELVEEQLQSELRMFQCVEKIARMKGEKVKNEYVWNTLSRMWKKDIFEALTKNLKSLEIQAIRNPGKMTIFPYLKTVDPKMYVDIILAEVHELASTSEAYSPATGFLYDGLGGKVWQMHILKRKIKNKRTFEKVKDHCREYCHWYINPKGPSRNFRQKWQMLLEDCNDIGVIDEKCMRWPSAVRRAIGKFLYSVLLKSTLVYPELINLNKEGKPFPAFYLVLRYNGAEVTEEIKAHPVFRKLYLEANVKHLYFNVNQLPMVCPPKPWCTGDSGGYYLLPADFMRYTTSFVNERLLHSIPNQNLYPVFDALNQIQSVAWRINTKVLDTIIELFHKGGSELLCVPCHPDENDIPPPPSRISTLRERNKAYEEWRLVLEKRNNDYGLWCEAVYKLSLANHYRDKILWLPHNMDFRGRIYPIPPHVCHISADLYRSLFLFAKKKPLGERGMDWLKIHTINLTGKYKRKSLSERLAYANSVLPEIIDSAENPLGENKWWTESEEPWQTLAACIEINEAMKCPDPTSYRTGFPVHQDGSCNGLQHYAALGRDKFGAASVNLQPNDVPQDVYSVVTNIVERARKKDAQAGIKIAQILDGFVTRKVVKQTVMTTVYGVTQYGAKLQIAKKLEDIPDFPRVHVMEGAKYLTCGVFNSLHEMFTSAQNIQKWLVNCADLICKHGETVSWVTPLGLPVMQPYFNKISSENMLPNSRKQKNAFPPNFIHSLDSTHMFLTALFCVPEGITFASVHDCFWTHPATVDPMNRICREQFVALHSKDILSMLLKHFNTVYPHSLATNAAFTAIPQVGTFDLEEVKNSVYFFS